MFQQLVGTTTTSFYGTSLHMFPSVCWYNIVLPNKVQFSFVTHHNPRFSHFSKNHRSIWKFFASPNSPRNYDSDKQIPVYGFGARVAAHGPMSAVSHCFSLTQVVSGNPQLSPEVFDIQGVQQIYSQALPRVQLSGPTLFAPLLNNFVQSVKCGDKRNNYHILLHLPYKHACM